MDYSRSHRDLERMLADCKYKKSMENNEIKRKKSTVRTRIASPTLLATKLYANRSLFFSFVLHF